MPSTRKRLTIDLDPAFQRRLKAIAALKGVAMREYCLAAIDQELSKDESIGLRGLLDGVSDYERFAELRETVFGGRPLQGDSADLIREARAIREVESIDWS